MYNFLQWLVPISATNWYLSADGNNTVHCGETRITPCHTLSWLLTVARKKTHMTSFQIMTDKDLDFDQKILVSPHQSLVPIYY